MLFRALAAPVILILLVTPLVAIDADRDFTGRWVLDLDGSNPRARAMQPDQFLNVTQQENRIHCSATDASGAVTEWNYALDGADSKYRLHGESMNSVVKW